MGRMILVKVKLSCVSVPVVKTKFTCHGAFYKRRAKTIEVVKEVSFLLLAVMLWRTLSGQKLFRKSLALKHNGPVV
jgi:hypothetical protein